MSGNSGAGNRSRRRLHLDDDLTVISECRHEISGARLILARNNVSEAHPFVTAWVAPWQKTIRDFTLHETQEAAAAWFDMKRDSEPPVTADLKRDWLQNTVYGWEGKTIRRHDSALSREHMKKIAECVSKDFNLVSVPTISARKKQNRNLADYNDEKNHIRVHNGQWRLSYVLHELAHAIDGRVNGNKWAAHGPSFMRTLLIVVEKYKYWHDAQNLEDLAVKDGIMIAPEQALPISRPQ